MVLCFEHRVPPAWQARQRGKAQQRELADIGPLYYSEQARAHQLRHYQTKVKSSHHQAVSLPVGYLAARGVESNPQDPSVQPQTLRKRWVLAKCKSHTPNV
jgi:hypothetical protein